MLRSVLWALRQKSWTMKILWVAGHYFLGENERSEEEARRRGRSELSREESVNLSLQVRPPHGPRQLVRAGRKTLFCGGQILWRGEWDSAAPVGLVLGLQGGEMEGLIRRESLGFGGDAPQGLGATQSYSEVPEVKHNKNYTSKTTSSSSGPEKYALLPTLGHFLYIYIYALHTNLTAYATFYHSERCLWINLVYSMHLTEFTTNPTTTDCTRVFPKVTLQNLILWDKDLHLSVVYLQASSLHCSFTRVKTLNHFFHRHWRLRQYLSYTCSCNW